MFKESRNLSILLWLGGVPPVVSGILASVAPGLYLELAGISDALSVAGNQAIAFIFHLQGGDAWVAGLGRITIALFGSLLLKRITISIAIVHSLYEIWLLPVRGLGWCEENAGVCSSLFVSELWAFVGLHVVLVVGSILAFLASKGSTIRRLTVGKM